MKFKNFVEIKNIGIINEKSYCENLNLTAVKKDGKKFTLSRVIINANNGAGKSTISNLFRSIELYNNEENEKFITLISKLKNIHKEDDIVAKINIGDANSVETLLEYDSVNKKWLNSDKINIRVFNDDYIDNNIDLKSFEKNELKSQIESKEIQLSSEAKEKNKAVKDYNDHIKSIEEITEDIKNEIVTRKKVFKDQFTNDKFIKISDDFNDYLKEPLINVDKRTQNNQELLSHIKNYKIYISAENFTPITQEKKENYKLIEIDKILELLKYSEDKTKIEFMDDLLRYKQEEIEWKLKGLDYIADKKCPFCGTNNIENSDIIIYYREYKINKISEYKEYLNKITADIKRIINTFKDILSVEFNIEKYKSITNGKWEIYEKKRIDANLLKDKCESIINIISEKDWYTSISEEKIILLNSLFTEYNFELEKIDELEQMILYINTSMLANKTNVATIRRTVEKIARENIRDDIDKYIIKYAKLVAESQGLENAYKLKDKIYKDKLSESKETVCVMNKIMQYMCLGKYKIDSDFNLVYKNRDISNKTYILSTGEISALAFAYFIASLYTETSEQDKKNGNLLIVIDDPVNSVDYERIYSFASLIKELASKFSPQLILLTHNALLYNILVQSNWFDKNKAKAYNLFIENEESCVKENGNNKNTIFLSQLIKIIQISNYSNASNIKNDEKIFIPNYLRCVIEQLNFLSNPDFENGQGAKYNFIKNYIGEEDGTNDKYAVLDIFMNHNSHYEPAYEIEGKLTEQELLNCCKLISEIVGKKFKDLHSYCMQECANSSTGGQ